MTHSAQRSLSSNFANEFEVSRAAEAGSLWLYGAASFSSKSGNRSHDTASGIHGTTPEVCSSFPMCRVLNVQIQGLLALATGAYATLLAIPGRQVGHVQLVHLPPCVPPTSIGPPSSSLPRKPPPPPTKHPAAIIAAHTTALTTLSVTPSGRLLATTSSRGTLVRTWDAVTGKLVREFRRGTDKAEIFGVAFRPDEHELCVWSDKGTVHVFNLVVSGAS